MRGGWLRRFWMGMTVEVWTEDIYVKIASRLGKKVLDERGIQNIAKIV